MGKKELKKIIEKRVLSGEYSIRMDETCGARSRDRLFFVRRQLGILCESELPFYYSKINRNILIADYISFDSKEKASQPTGCLSGLIIKKKPPLKKQATRLSGPFKMLPPVSKGPGNAKSYLINCTVRFEEHYARLDTYKDALLKGGIYDPSCRIKTCFFIEDTTPLGSYILDGEGMEEIVLFYVKQFLNLFEASRQLDYVFFGNFKGRSDGLWFMGREDISCYRKKESDILRKNYFAFDAGNNGQR